MGDAKHTVSVDELRDLLAYNEQTGEFRWRRDHGCKHKAGEIVGTDKTDGYRQIKLLRRNYLAHRLAWLYVKGEWPSETIDHIDGDKRNNSFSNLRLASVRQNQHNKRLTKSNSTGFKGVHLRKDNGMFASHIRVGGKLIYLGQFASPEAAHAAYADAAKKHFGEFARIA